ncbi:hypothetical protein [Microbacterium hydrocarbonoxydans]|uniref:hypothetical protein n=1 Tax=Microbacterium hydrocarbonoxydans TaxID=273678 RepID=UPI0007BB4BCE|nr:hypothetical protein [Microbacterium hydrocarbonoxydans]GAT73224.1 permease [Microbacterium sp. HM58-2]
MKKKLVHALAVLGLVIGSFGVATTAAPPAQAATAGCAASLIGVTPPSLFYWNRVPYGIEAIVRNLRTTDVALLQTKTSSGWSTRDRITIPRPGEVLRADARKGSVWRVVIKRGPTPTGFCATYTFGPVTR